jgi:hypothetical protein
MTKYTANIIGTAKTSSGSGAWDLFDQGELVRNGRWETSGVTTGGNIANGVSKTIGATTYKYHTFTVPGTFTVGAGTTFEVLLVGGGAPGGYPASGGPYPATNYGGGGGSGGIVYATAIPLSSGVYDVTVGTGGSSNANGTDSTLYSRSLGQNILIAKGGGTAADSGPAQPGGSGGGGSNSFTTGSTGTQPGIVQFFPSTPINSGNPGNNKPAPVAAGGGGGSSGSASPTLSIGTPGVLITPNYLDFYGETIGLPSLNPLSGFYGGGGGGSVFSPPPGTGATDPLSPNRSGATGGGNGEYFRPAYSFLSGQTSVPVAANPIVATDAIQYTGGGGGGGLGPPFLPQPNPLSGKGTNGADGIVVIRYVS